MPVIATATAAPAYATSTSNLSTSTAASKLVAYGFFGLNQRTDTTVVLRNTGTGPTTALTVTISTAGDLTGAGSQPEAPAGWVLTSVSTGTDTAVFTRTTQLTGGATETVTFALRRSFDFAGDTVTVVVSPGGGGPGANVTLSNVTF